MRPRSDEPATYYHGCLWFDHSHPPERGYGYVAASRFVSKDGIYLYGKVRSTDWLPVRPIAEDDKDQPKRSSESGSSCCTDDDADYEDVARRHSYMADYVYGDEEHGDEASSEQSYLSDAEYAHRLLEADFDFKQVPKTDNGTGTPMESDRNSILRS